MQTDTFNFKCVNCNYTRSIIPRDCTVCDSCNTAITDEKFIAKRTAYYYEDHLYCDDCHTKAQKDYPREAYTLKMKILEHDDLSNTVLAEPIIMEFF